MPHRFRIGGRGMRRYETTIHCEFTTHLTYMYIYTDTKYYYYIIIVIIVIIILRTAAAA